MKLASLALLAAPFLVGCGLRTHAGLVAEPAVWPMTATATQKPSISIYCRSRYTYTGKETVTSAAPCGDAYLNTFKESGLFSNVLNGLEGGDMRVVMTREVLPYVFDMGNDIASSFTMLLVPFVISNDNYLTTELYDGKGAQIDKTLMFEHSTGYYALWSMPNIGDSFTMTHLVKATLAELQHRGSLGS